MAAQGAGLPGAGAGLPGSGAPGTAGTAGTAGGWDADKKGWLLKWANYLKGYQRRWFVLHNGVLSYYRFEGGGRSLSLRRRRGPRQQNQADMAHTCRGTITLGRALIHTVDPCTFIISNGGTQTFHIRASNEVERQSWVTALELAKAKAIRVAESEDEEDSATVSTVEAGAVVERELTTRLNDLSECLDLINRHGTALQRALADLGQPDEQIQEKATLFRITCNLMMNSCQKFIKVAETHCNRYGRLLQHEREQKQRLQEVVEQLARQHDNLEKSVHAQPPASKNQPAGSTRDSEEDDEHEFYDAQDGGASGHTSDENSFVINIPIKDNRRGDESSEDSETETVTETQQVLFVADQPGTGGGTPGNGSGRTGSSSEGATDSEKEADSKSTKSLKDKAQSNGQIVKVSYKKYLRIYFLRPPFMPYPCAGPSWEHKLTEAPVHGFDVKGVQEKPHVSQVMPASGTRARRTRIPDKPNYPLNLWSIMKNCIGKDLSKIPIPVNFSEPLSMLQRLTEEFEYSNLLDIAARCEDPCEQLAYVAAFTVSSYSTTTDRVSKPFNPLLFETYECDRMEDLGWRAISEQVSHHPPMVAQYVEGAAGWKCWQEFTMTSKFRGKYLQVIPLGSAYVEFTASGHRYKWRKVTTTVHNIIVGKLWVDEHGDMEIIGEGTATGRKCHLKYLPYSYFSKDTQRKVTGLVKSTHGKPKWVIQGHWDSKIEIAPVTSTNADSTVCKTGKYITAWQKVMPPEDSYKYYGFTILACQLNEMEDGICPTDSRYRPDQRLMEEGKWNEANEEKVRLEEKQRSKRRQLEAEAEAAANRKEAPPPSVQPVWFTRQHAPAGMSESSMHVFNGDYWDCKERQDWSRCPDIF